MLDCKGAMRPKAGLAREDLLINVSEIKKKKVAHNSLKRSFCGLLSQSFKGRKEGIIEMLQIRQRFKKG